jgi:phage tail protein X
MLPIRPVVNTPESDASEESVLPEDALRRVDDLGSADLLVGIPCFDNADTIGGVVVAVEAGLRKLFPNLRAVICASDGGSSDGTLETAAAAGVGRRTQRYLIPPDSPVPLKLGFRYGGASGKGSAVRAIFEVARRLDVRACAIVDADLRSITPYWIDRLLAPVVHHGYEFVAPVHARHKHDGTITNALAYPLTTTLYGVRLRQPIGGEFAFSGALAARYAEGDVWGTEVARFGIDVWLTTTAVVEGWNTCQSILGAKLHDPKDPGRDLAPMFRQVVGTLFELAVRNAERWLPVDEVTNAPTLGFESEFATEPVEVSLDDLGRGFAEGRDRYRERWTTVLSADPLAAALNADPSEPTLNPEPWFLALLDYLVAYRTAADGQELVDSLVPLYYARTATFVRQTLDADQDEAERLIEEGVDVAVALKPHLRERWTADVPARQ